MPNLRQVGTHDTGFWDRENKIAADPKASAENLSVKEALSQAKSQKGAELVVIQEDGTANVHALQGQDGFASENKQILISELDRDPRSKQDLGKTPLAIDDKVAQAFGGKGAFLVDEKNNTTYLGEDVDVATPTSKLQEAEQFLKAPTQEKVNAAYAIAEDAGKPAHIDSAMGKNVLNQLQSNYRQGDQAAQDVSYLKPGDTQEKITALTVDLGRIAGQEAERTGQLNDQLKDRTADWQQANGEATQARDKALGQWNQAQRAEAGKVDQAARQLREARMPGVHATESQLKEAQGQSSQARSQYERAQSIRQQASNNVDALERLPASADNHLTQARRLEDNNREIQFQARTYTTVTLSQVRNDVRRVEREYDRTNYELQNERNKPPRPSSNNSSGDPFGNDPFNGGGNNVSSDPFGKDPFSGGGSGGSSNDPFGKDPFNGNGGGQYRDENRIRSLQNQLSRLSSESRNLQARENGLERVNTQLAFNDVDNLNLIFMDLNFTDRTTLGRYGDQMRRNDTNIRKHEQTARQENDRYRREINPARQQLNNATTQETAARSRFTEAEAQVARVENQLNDIKRNPRPDSDPAVKPAATAHQKALEHQEATVGAQAPLTQKRDQTQAALTAIDRSYQADKQDLESQLRNVKNTLEGEAQQAIQKTRQALKL